MSDSDFVDVGDELVVRIAGYPVGRATVKRVYSDCVVVNFGRKSYTLPLDFKEYDVTDGVAHEKKPVPVNDFGEDINGDYPGYPSDDNYDPTRYDNGYTYDRT